MVPRNKGHRQQLVMWAGWALAVLSYRIGWRDLAGREGREKEQGLGHRLEAHQREPGDGD